METRRFAFIAALLTIAGLSACATPSPVEQREQAATNLDQTKQEMTTLRDQLDQTLSSLNALMSSGGGDLNEAYQRYASDVQKLREQSAALDKGAQRMRDQSNDYLAHWRDTQSRVQDPELRAMSLERRQMVMDNFERANLAYQEARIAFTPLLRDLEDVRRVVGNDLTPTGVQIVARSEAVQKANASGQQAARTMDQAINEFDQLSGRLTPR